MSQYNNIKVELKPCPFCGGKAKRINAGAFCYVGCSNSKCVVTPYTYGYKRMSDATKAWNRRK